MSSRSRACSDEEATTRKTPRWSTRTRPAAFTSVSSTQRRHRVCRRSTTSKSFVNVSASSTNVRLSCASRSTLITSRPGATKGMHPRYRIPSRLDLETSCHDISCDFIDGPPAGEGERAHSGERVGQPDIELSGDHPRRLMHHGPVCPLPVEPGPELPRRCPHLHLQENRRRDLRQREPVGDLF